MKAEQRIDCGNDTTKNGNTDVAHAATATSVTTTGLSSVNTSNSSPNLPGDELVALWLKDRSRTKFLGNFSLVGVLHLSTGTVQHLVSHTKHMREHVKYNTPLSKPTISKSVQSKNVSTKDLIQLVNPPNTPHIVCRIYQGCCFFGSLDFLMVIML